MRLSGFDAYWAKVPTVCGALLGAIAGALSFLSEVAMQLLGVPLPVVIASSAAAGMARAFGAPMGFFRACGVTAGWTVLGCVCAPGAQALLPAVAQLVPGLGAVVLPANALAFVAAVVSSAPWWWPKVWPLIQARFGLGKGAAP